MARILLISTAFFILALMVIYQLNLFCYEAYYKNLTLKSGSIKFDPDPDEYDKNHHVILDAAETENNFTINYTFRDHNKNEYSWTWTYPREVTIASIDKFGIPLFIFEPYYPVDSVVKARNRIIKEGMFVMEDNLVGPDLTSMIKNYRPTLKPIVEKIENSMGNEDSRRERIEFIMKFIQDIPYCIPPAEQGDKYTGGVFPPPQVFINRYGDCDSKVVIFGSLLSFYEKYEMLILQETGHILSGIKGFPKPYDKYYEYRNNKYILAETTGPGRSDFGVINDPYKKYNEVYPVRLD